jgi:hypothetical protein
MTLRPRGGGGLQTLFHSTHLSPSAPRAAHTLWHPACWTILVALRTSSRAVAEIGAAVEGRTLTKLMAIAATTAPKIKCIAFSCEGDPVGRISPRNSKGTTSVLKRDHPLSKGASTEIRNADDREERHAFLCRDGPQESGIMDHRGAVLSAKAADE